MGRLSHGEFLSAQRVSSTGHGSARTVVIGLGRRANVLFTRSGTWDPHWRETNNQRSTELST